MSNPYINLYKGNPTAGETDGTAISTDGEYTSPLSITLDASQNETKKEKLAVRCESGYQTDGNTVIEDSNDTNDRWKFSLLEDGVYSDAITIGGVIDTVNTVFWVQASADSLESPQRDQSVGIKLTTVIVAS